jgi:phage FluMu gp28-like protein
MKNQTIRNRAKGKARTAEPAVLAEYGTAATDQIKQVLERRLYPYQRRWIEDHSRFKLGLWARQTGKDFTCAAEAVADCLRYPASQWLIIACTERQAFQSLEKVKEWAEEFGCAVEGNLSQVRFSNGSRITTLPAKPASIRGYSANLILTEFAFHDDCEAVWRAAFPVVTRPGKDGRTKKVRIISTPNGRSNLFYRLWTGKTFSKHFIGIHDAIAQGLPLNAAELEAGLADPEAWSQEYLCQFIDNSSVLLPDDLLARCQSPEASEQADPQQLSTCRGELFMGVACGLERTVCWILEDVRPSQADLHSYGAQSCLLTREVLVLDHLSIPDQVEALRHRAARARRVWLDYRGPGVGTGQHLARHLNIPRHPRALARCLENVGGPKNLKLQMEPLTPAFQSELVGELQAALQTGRVRLPVSDAIREELHSLQAVLSDTGQVTYRAGRNGAGTGQPSSSGERVTALALALRAALESGVTLA